MREGARVGLKDRARRSQIPISVGAPWRRRGLARALIAKALHARRDLGMNESVLGVDADNAHDAGILSEASSAMSRARVTR